MCVGTTRRSSRAGWGAGGLGTSWYNDPAEDLITILLTNRMWSSPNPPPMFQDFWEHAYEAVRD